MAANNELRLISAIILDRDLTTALEEGVTEDLFRDPTYREQFAFIRDHWSEHGITPSKASFKEEWPTSRVLNTTDPVAYFAKHIVKWNRRAKVVEALQEGQALIEDENDWEASLHVLQKCIAEVETTGGQANDVNLADTTEKRRKEYKALSERKSKLLGIATGFPTIDQATQGLCDGQLVTVVATPKAGKSTLMLKIADNIHKKSFVPLLQSYEMANTEQQTRLDAMRARISHNHLRTGKMTKDEWAALHASLDRMREDEEDFFLTADVASNTVTGLLAKVEKYKPNVVFVDGVYLMTDELTGEQNTPLALTNITRNLKRAAQRTNIPWVISTQALTWKVQKRKVTADSIGYSSSFFQDSDVILGLQTIEGSDGEDVDDLRMLKVVASRNCPRVDVELFWDWETSTFGEVHDEGTYGGEPSQEKRAA